MTRLLLSAACVLGAASFAGAAPAIPPAEQVATGRERSPADHDYYRPAEPAPRPSPLAADTGAGRLGPTADEWVELARRWLAGFGF